MGEVKEGVVEIESDSAEPVPSEESLANKEESSGYSRPKAFKVEHVRSKKKWRWLSRSAVISPPGVRMDILCMMCALFGLISLALPWVSDPNHYHGEYQTLWNYAISPEGEGLNVFGLAAGFILIGSLLALFTRLGGLVQMGGLISFLTISMPSSNTISIGFFCALFGCVAGIFSLVLRKSYAIPQRFCTLNLQAHRDRLEINLISILAGSIGLMCLVLPWVEVTVHMSYYYSDQTDLITLYQFSSEYFGSILIWVAAVMFVAGSIVAILSPLGAIAQIAACGMFLYDLRGFAGYAASYFGHYPGPSAETSFSIGFFLGLICALVGLATLFVPWRLRLSRRAASWFIAWPVGTSSPSSQSEVSEPKASEEFSVMKAVKSTMKALIITIVVLAIILASATLAYVVPWSTLDVSVSSNYPSQELHIAIFLDGDSRVIDFVNAGTVLEKSFKVRAGVHRVAFDYGVVGDENGSQMDGLVDWATSIKVKPLRTSFLTVGLGVSYYERPVVELSSSPYGNGERVNITIVNDGTYSLVSWNDIRIMLRDGTNTTQWMPSAMDLHNYTYTEYSFRPVLLGELNVTCTIVDLMGDGYLNEGDYMTFTTGADKTFGSAVTYTLYLLYEPFSSLTAEFEFQGRN